MMTTHICEKCRREIKGLDPQWEPAEYFWHEGCSNGDNENYPQKR